MSNRSACRIVLVEDHKTVREGLKKLIEDTPGMVVCGEATNAADGLAIISQQQPDVAIVDLSLSNSNGLDLVSSLNEASSTTRAIVFSSRPAWLLAERMLKAGASGYLRKSTGDELIIQAIKDVMQGKTFVSEGVVLEAETDHDLGESLKQLADQEYQVFDLVGQGLEATDIATQLGCSVNTVRTKLERLKAKLGHKRMSDLRRAAISWQVDMRL